MGECNEALNHSKKPLFCLKKIQSSHGDSTKYRVYIARAMIAFRERQEILLNYQPRMVLFQKITM